MERLDSNWFKELELRILNNIEFGRRINNEFYNSPIYKFKNRNKKNNDLYVQVNTTRLLLDEEETNKKYIIYNIELLKNNDLIMYAKNLVSKDKYKNNTVFYIDNVKNSYVLMNSANFYILREYIIPLNKVLKEEKNDEKLLTELVKVFEKLESLDNDFLYYTTLNIFDMNNEEKLLNYFKELYQKKLINHLIIFSPFVEFKDYEEELKRLGKEFGVIYEKEISLEEFYKAAIRKLIKENNKKLYKKNK